jgi:hypothetical protein
LEFVENSWTGIRLTAADACAQMIELRLYGSGALGEQIDGLTKFFQEVFEAADARFQLEAFRRRFQRCRANGPN